MVQKNENKFENIDLQLYTEYSTLWKSFTGVKEMAISYNKLWEMLIDKDMNKGELCDRAKISKGTMAKMTNNEPVTLTVIEKICIELNCDISDVVEMTRKQYLDKTGEIHMGENFLDKKYKYWQNQ